MAAAAAKPPSLAWRALLAAVAALSLCSRRASALDAAVALRESARFGGPATLEGLCSALGERLGAAPGTVRPIKNESAWPRIYDVFPVNDDLDVLEIRLNELHTVVDYFVIAESNATFTNRDKRIMYRDVKERFRRFWPQIIYVPVDTFHVSAKDPEAHWHREREIRGVNVERGMRTGDDRAARDGDLMLFGDVDEIPRGWVLQGLRVCEGYNPGKVRLAMRFTYYAYSVLHAPDGGGGSTWTASIVHRFDPRRNYTDAADLRGDGYGGNTGKIRDAGWHCTFCFRTYQQFVSKIRGFSHVEYGANLHFSTREHIVESVRKGLDIFDRPDQRYNFFEVTDQDAPMEVLMHKGRYHYMLDRRGPTAALEGLDD